MTSHVCRDGRAREKKGAMNNPRQLTPQFLTDLKKFTAVTAVGVQALRRQGIGAIGCIQERLEALGLSQTTSIENQEGFVRWLDKETDVLMERCKVSWGAARKALNLFMRACFYNRYLSAEFDLDHLETWLEIPLDRVIAEQIRNKAELNLLSPWQGLGALTKEKSDSFQKCASDLAAKERLSRVHLDVGLWVHNRKR